MRWRRSRAWGSARSSATVSPCWRCCAGRRIPSAMIEMPADAAGWQRWLATEVMPFWVGKLVAPHGYVEYLTPAGEPAGAPLPRSPLVTGRLIYCFSQAHLLGSTGALDAARHGFRFLTEHCW